MAGKFDRLRRLRRVGHRCLHSANIDRGAPAKDTWRRAVEIRILARRPASPSGAIDFRDPMFIRDVAMTTDVDVLIIGAGASGAALAWSLAETRMRVLCLGQGDWGNPVGSP